MDINYKSNSLGISYLVILICDNLHMFAHLYDKKYYYKNVSYNSYDNEKFDLYIITVYKFP